MVRTEHLLSAAFAALVVATPVIAQQPGAASTSVTLDQALQRAQFVSPTVIQSQGAIRSAQLNIRSAIWAFIPALTVTPQASLQLSSGQSRLDPITQEIISGNSNVPSLSFGASATYTIFDGFARNYNLKAQRALETGADAQLITAKFTSDLNTTTAFFLALGARQLVAVAQSNVDQAGAQLTLASARLHAGAGQLSDSLSARGSYLQAELGLLQAQNNLVLYEGGLGHLVGVPGRVAAIDDSAYYRTTIVFDTAAIRVEVMNTSPTIKSLETSVISAQQVWKSSKAGYLPTLSANAAESWTATKPDYDFVARRSLGITLSVSPWTSYARERTIENNAIAVTNAEAELADTRNALAVQVDQAFGLISTAQETIVFANAEVEADSENVRVVTERYRIGVATITDVLTAQNQLITAQSAQVQARFSFLNAKSQLEEILGRKL